MASCFCKDVCNHFSKLTYLQVNCAEMLGGEIMTFHCKVPFCFFFFFPSQSSFPSYFVCCMELGGKQQEIQIPKGTSGHFV